MSKSRYAFNAAATRGSAGAELLALGEVEGAPVGVGGELLDAADVLGVVLWLFGALSPGLGDPLPLQAATATTKSAAAPRVGHEDLRTDHLLSRG